MKTAFVDSNVFLRFVTRDDAGQHEKVLGLFHRAASGQVALVTGPPVLFEVAWALRARYHLPREKILELFSAISAFRGLTLLDGDIVAEAIALASRTDSHFADAYLAASARAVVADEIATFNRAPFDRLGAKVMEL